MVSEVESMCFFGNIYQLDINFFLVGKITKGKQRLALSGKSEGAALTPAQTQRNTEQINLLSERINGLVEEAERAGTEGNVEQAQGLMKLCDQLKEERETLRKQNENSHWSATAELAAAQEKQMEVCDVCGAFLIVGDAQQRIDDHLMGKSSDKINSSCFI